MRASPLFAIFGCLWIAGILMGGCSTGKSQQQDSFKSYREKMEMKKGALAKEEERQVKVSELGVEGCERLGDLYLRQGNMDLAFIQYYRALRIDPAQIPIRYKLGRLLLERGVPEEAKKEFKEILKRNPDHALAYEGMGRVYFKEGNFFESEKNFQKALRLKSNLWQAHNFLGIIYDHQEQFRSAIDEYQSAIAIQPDEGLLFNNLGISLYLSGEYEKAVEAFQKAVRVGKTSPKIYNNLALALCKLEKYEEGFEAFKRAGDEASANYSMGCIYMFEGKFKEAIESFEKAMQMKPAFYVKAHENLKKAREALLSRQTKEEEGISKSENH